MQGKPVRHPRPRPRQRRSRPVPGKLAWGLLHQQARPSLPRSGRNREECQRPRPLPARQRAPPRRPHPTIPLGLQPLLPVAGRERVRRVARGRGGRRSAAHRCGAHFEVDVIGSTFTRRSDSGRARSAGGRGASEERGAAHPHWGGPGDGRRRSRSGPTRASSAPEGPAHAKCGTSRAWAGAETAADRCLVVHRKGSHPTGMGRHPHEAEPARSMSVGSRHGARYHQRQGPRSANANGGRGGRYVLGPKAPVWRPKATQPSPAAQAQAVAQAKSSSPRPPTQRRRHR